MSGRRLLIISNRLPVQVRRVGRQTQVVPSDGGLVRALQQGTGAGPVVWLGWPGAALDHDAEIALAASSRESNMELRAVSLSTGECDDFYNGFCNEIVWPLFHDLQTRCNFEPRYWQAYLEVNQRFAEAARAILEPEDLVWVHDYHLVHLAQLLRRESVPVPLGFFLHIPFPPHDIFEKLPWNRDFLLALLAYDVLGFQTDRDLRNFHECLRLIMPEAEVQPTPSGTLEIGLAYRTTSAGVYPISIDFQAFEHAAASPEVEARVAELRSTVSCSLALGVDRLDYTKGIPERLKAYQLLLAIEPQLRGKVCLLQVVVPSRESVPRYQELKLEVERMVGAINGEFATPGWTPVQYLYRSLETQELLAFYRAADLALITPLKDGMNLVAKEFCAAKVDGDGVLVLSRFAGAAAQMRSGALLVNPYDSLGTAQAMRRALLMPTQERRFRMRRLRANLRQSDVHGWMQSFRAALERPPGELSSLKASGLSATA